MANVSINWVRLTGIGLVGPLMLKSSAKWMFLTVGSRDNCDGGWIGRPQDGVWIHHQQSMEMSKVTCYLVRDIMNSLGLFKVFRIWLARIRFFFIPFFCKFTSFYVINKAYKLMINTCLSWYLQVIKSIYIYIWWMLF